MQPDCGTAGPHSRTTDAVVGDSGQPDIVAPDAQQHLVQDLPEETLVYLLGSRYCETDRLSDTGMVAVWNDAARLGARAGGLRFVPSYYFRLRLRPHQDGVGAFNEGSGVCRDYAHLAIAFCRCLNIPARYCTGYLGDIGVPPCADPMDFSGWFEAYLGGRWYTFDARLTSRVSAEVLIARGRDAADVAISSTFGLTHWRASRCGRKR